MRSQRAISYGELVEEKKGGGVKKPFESHVWKRESMARRRLLNVDWISERTEATLDEEERRGRFGAGEGGDGGRFEGDNIEGVRFR